MGELKDQVSKQIKAAMKARDKVRLNVLRYIKKLFIENDTSGKPKPEIDIVISYGKKMKDSISMYPDGSTQQENIKAECTIISEFLPQPLTTQEVATIIDEINLRLVNPNMGAIMKELSPKIKGRFDGLLASQMVQAVLKK
ncbi:MAG: GatB/YqeY domain-containing protein [Bacteriovoracaceae bacterium]|nr:GatB/YqeY domain-containing protein [Bacteriovoracaceae bacterium]